MMGKILKKTEEELSVWLDFDKDIEPNKRYRITIDFDRECNIYEIEIAGIVETLIPKELNHE